MPMYEYQCEAHGTFEEIGSMARANEGAPCPECERTSPRVLSPPRLRQLASTVRTAHERNERSQHEPRVHRKERGCTEHHHHHAAPGAPAPSAARKYGGPRPWVVEHG